MAHLKAHWKKYALAAAGAAAAYYGIDPDLAQEFLSGFAGALAQ